MKKKAVLMTIVILLQLLSSCKSDDGKGVGIANVTNESAESAAATVESIESTATSDAESDSMPESGRESAVVPREEIVSLEYQKTYTVTYTLTVDYVLDAQNLFMKPKFAAVSDAAEEIQAEIDALYAKFDEVMEQMEAGTYKDEFIYRITYDVYVTDRYLTLLITNAAGLPASEYDFTYNCFYYDMEENRRTDVVEILADMGYTLDDVVFAAHDYFWGMVGVKPITSIEDLDIIVPHCQNRVFAAVKDLSFSPRGDFSLIKTT